MPLLLRSGCRFSWLSINIVLNVIAASVIALHTDALAAAIALAVFLPMITDMCGFFLVLSIVTAVLPKLGGG